MASDKISNKSLIMTTSLLPIESHWFDELIRIEQLVHSHPWATSLLRKPANQIDCNRVLVSQQKLIGYFFAQCVAGEASLLNIAIAPNFQGQGYGQQLLNAFLDCMREAGAQEAWLEVRQSNIKAISLYQSVGFNEFDRRINYYPCAKGHEDAIIMSYWFD